MSDHPDHGLRAFRVVEVARDSVGAAFCGLVLHRLGMEVVKIESPGTPDPVRSIPPLAPDAGPDDPGLPFSFLNAGKTIAAVAGALDVHNPAVVAHLERADVVIQGGCHPADMAFAAGLLRQRWQGIVEVAVSPLGREALGAGELADDFTAFHRSGLGFITPRTMPGFPTAGKRPLRPYSRIIEMLAGYQAAIAVLAGLIGRAASGEGESFDVAAAQCGLPLVRREMAAWQYNGWIATRGARSWVVAPSGIQRCSDGHVFVSVIEERQWRNLCELMGTEALIDDPRFGSHVARFEHNDQLLPIMDAWFSVRTKSEVTRLGQEKIVPIAPVNAPRDLFEYPQLLARDWFRELPTGGRHALRVPRLAFELSLGDLQGPAAATSVPGATGGIGGVAARSARPGGHDARFSASLDGPLKGFRILELTHVWAGPLCGQILADLGAEVIRLESHRRIDVHRNGSPYAGNVPGLNRSGVFNSQNRGKLSCTLNLADEEGRELARDLVGRCDGVIENFSPGTLERMGLGFDVLRSIRDDVVLLSLSAYGQTGPQRSFRGYGPMLDADCGVMFATDYGDRIPRAVNGWLGDIGGAMNGAVAMLAGLLARRAGAARWIDISELEAAALFQFESLLAWSARREEVRPVGNLAPYGAFTECFACRGEDSWIAISCPTAAATAILARIVGAAAPGDGAKTATPPAEHFAALAEATAAWLGDRDRDDAVRALQGEGIVCGPVSNVVDLLNDPVLRSRGAYVRTHHRELGEMDTYGPVWRLSRQPPHNELPAPCMGEHNRYVFETLLGLEPTVVDGLVERGIIG